MLHRHYSLVLLKNGLIIIVISIFPRTPWTSASLNLYHWQGAYIQIIESKDRRDPATLHSVSATVHRDASIYTPSSLATSTTHQGYITHILLR